VEKALRLKRDKSKIIFMAKSTFKPYILPSATIKEFTFRAIVIGIILGLVFAVGISYLGLKVGMTISASIPAAAASMAILKLFKKPTILENNLAQTIASAGDGLAAGVIFTLPALFFAGIQPSQHYIIILAILGGFLGALFMIPLREFIIVEEHDKLPFPEGTACAEILKAGSRRESGARFAFIGVLVGGLYRALLSIFHLFPETLTWRLPFLKKGVFSVDCAPALLGVGYIIGPSIAFVILSGSLLSWWIIIPLIEYFGLGATIFPGKVPIASMNAAELWSSYIRYIGAGAIGVAGLFGFIRILPKLYRIFEMAIRDHRQKRGKQKVPRTQVNLPLWFVALGSIIIAVLLYFIPQLDMNLLTVFITIIFGFFFVAVTSFIVGLVGVSSSPLSGMILTTILITTGLFLAFGWTGERYLVLAITVGALVSISSAIAADTSQDLKTGFLIGATPRAQQVGMLIGIFFVSLIMGATLYLLNTAYVLGSIDMPAPQATMIYLITKGMLKGDLPLTLLLIGAVITLLLRLARVPLIPFAIGIYLPLSLTAAIFFGGLINLVHQHVSRKTISQNGTLMASGLVAGDALMGVIAAILTLMHFVVLGKSPHLPEIFSFIAFILLGLFFYSFSKRKTPKKIRS
jgi:putative OPT family oligopeptide transporter